MTSVLWKAQIAISPTSNLLSFPKFPLILEPDASDYQLSCMILQNTVTMHDASMIIKLFTWQCIDHATTDYKPITYYFSRKVSVDQKNYTIINKELLSPIAVETLS
jgi:hypothetical protein